MTHETELGDYFEALYELICLRLERGRHTKEEVTTFIKRVIEYVNQDETKETSR